MMTRRVAVGLGTLSVLLAASTGCPKPQPIPIAAPDTGKDYDRALPPGQLALRKITDPAMIPDFSDAFYNAQSGALRDAILRSLHYLGKRSSERYFPYGDVTHARAVESLRLFLDVLSRAKSPGELNQLIREEFDVYMSVGCDDMGTVLFTGYYTPIFDGSRTRTARFAYPIYKTPPDLRKDAEGNPAGGPWKTRQEIESGGALAGNELVWLEDRFKTYVVTIQGSGQIRMPDGRIEEIGYAANNGHDYKSIGKELVADGKIAKENLSLSSMLEYFRNNPQDIDTYCWRNPRYIFFQPAPGGPFGCLNEKVTTHYSIATDKDVYPRACLSFLDVSNFPTEAGSGARPYRGFALDQDRGAAIRAAGRCDVFMGVGDEAGRRAGFTYSEGKLYYLFKKDSPSYAGGPARTDTASSAAMDAPPAASPAPGSGSEETGSITVSPVRSQR